MHMLRKIGLVILLAWTSAAGMAEEAKNYSVEVVVFENLDPAAHQSEVWPTQVNFPLPAPLLELGSGNEIKHGFRSLPQTSAKLAQEIKQLEASGHYRILHHRYWRQPGLEVNAALPVRLKADVTSGTPPKTITMQLDGYVKVILGKFLHADIDLIFHDRDSTSAPVYRLKQSRKMRSKELHYIDSPVLGMLIYITPIN
jgi:Peptidoglycan-binding protein, CsiV